MNLATTPPPRQTLAQQLQAIQQGGCQLTFIAPKTTAMIGRVRKAIEHGERLPGLTLVRRIAAQGIAESTARSCIYAAHQHAVLASEGEGRNRVYWLNGAQH